MNYENNEQTQKTNAETKEGSERTKPTQSRGQMFFLLQYSEPCPSCHLSQEAGTQRDCIGEREAGIDRESKVGKHSREREREMFVGEGLLCSGTGMLLAGRSATTHNTLSTVTDALSPGLLSLKHTGAHTRKHTVQTQKT